jgi:uncharacterized protein involved in tolerance to divalent cations
MKNASSFAVALVTAPELKSGWRRAQAAPATHSTLGANFIRGVGSRYRSCGKMEACAEARRLTKSKAPQLPALQGLALAKCP